MTTLVTPCCSKRSRRTRLLAFQLILVTVLPQIASATTVYISNTLKADEAGAVLEITQVKGIGVSGNQKMLIMPGERKRVYARHVTGFVLSRVYGDHKVLYDIVCPEDVRMKDVLNIGLQEIEKNAIGAGCEVSRQGKWSLENGTTWQPKKK